MDNTSSSSSSSLLLSSTLQQDRNTAATHRYTKNNSNTNVGNKDTSFGGPGCIYCAIFGQGPCKEQFDAYKECVTETHRNKKHCSPLFRPFIECAQSNKDYYAPIIKEVAGSGEDVQPDRNGS